MTPKKKPPVRRGRKPKKEGDKLEQLTIRLPSRTRFGIQLLARTLDKTVSEAMAWALNFALSKFELDSAGTPLSKLVDDVWNIENPGERMLRIYYQNPTLLAFEDRIACELVDSSVEFTVLLDQEASRRTGYGVLKSDSDRRTENTPTETNVLEQVRREYSTCQAQLYESYFAFVSTFWDAIKGVAVNLSNQGKSLRDRSLLEVMGLVVNKGESVWTVIDRLRDGNLA